VKLATVDWKVSLSSDSESDETWLWLSRGNGQLTAVWSLLSRMRVMCVVDPGGGSDLQGSERVRYLVFVYCDDKRRYTVECVAETQSLW
jgi:hypothetical protein